MSGSPMMTALPPVVEAGERVLVRHRPGQVQDVGDRRFGAGIRVEPGPAERGAQRG